VRIVGRGWKLETGNWKLGSAPWECVNNSHPNNFENSRQKSHVEDTTASIQGSCLLEYSHRFFVSKAGRNPNAPSGVNLCQDVTRQAVFPVSSFQFPVSNQRS